MVGTWGTGGADLSFLGGAGDVERSDVARRLALPLPFDGDGCLAAAREDCPAALPFFVFRAFGVVSGSCGL